MTALKLDPALPWKVHLSIGGKMIGQYSTAANAELDADLHHEPCAVVFDRRFDSMEDTHAPVILPHSAHRDGYQAALAEAKEILRRSEPGAMHERPHCWLEWCERCRRETYRSESVSCAACYDPRQDVSDKDRSDNNERL